MATELEGRIVRNEVYCAAVAVSAVQSSLRSEDRLDPLQVEQYRRECLGVRQKDAVLRVRDRGIDAGVVIDGAQTPDLHSHLVRRYEFYGGQHVLQIDGIRDALLRDILGLQRIHGDRGALQILASLLRSDDDLLESFPLLRLRCSRRWLRQSRHGIEEKSCAECQCKRARNAPPGIVATTGLCCPQAQMFFHVCPLPFARSHDA